MTKHNLKFFIVIKNTEYFKIKCFVFAFWDDKKMKRMKRLPHCGANLCIKDKKKAWM